MEGNIQIKKDEVRQQLTYPRFHLETIDLLINQRTVA